MSDDIENPKLYYFFREGILLQRSQITSSEVQPTGEVSSAPPKKGMQDHAERLIQFAVEQGISTVRPIYVVGDGRSDHFLFRSLERLRRRLHDMPQPEGLFLRNSTLEVYETNSDHCRYFPSWHDLSAALSEYDTALAERGLAIVDVDRTAILPRGTMDEVFLHVRRQSLCKLARQFALSSEALLEAENIVEYANELESSLCYYRDQGDKVCLENFEVIALTAILKMLGLLSDENICRTLPPDDELLDTLTLCRNEAKTGNWMAQLDNDTVGSNGHWSEESVVSFLTTAIESLENEDPSLCPIFRELECAELLEAKRRDACSFFNQPLLSVLLDTLAFEVIFVSDRPITSVFDGENFVLDLI